MEMIRNGDSIHVLFREAQFTLNDKFIAINMKTTSKEGRYKSYTTLMVEDNKILTEEIVLHDGYKKRCLLLYNEFR